VGVGRFNWKNICKLLHRDFNLNCGYIDLYAPFAPRERERERERERLPEEEASNTMSTREMTIALPIFDL